jgi:hypothetical protein
MRLVVSALLLLALAAAPGGPVTVEAQTQAQGILKITPEKGPAGSAFDVAGTARPGTTVDIQWTTWTGAYSTVTTSETVAYKQRVFSEKRISLGQLTANASGSFAGTFSVPEDFGQVHEIHAVVDGQDVARGGFQVLMAATATPLSGPIGTPIQLRVTGLNTNLFSGSTLALRYDNAYTGLLTAATTGGTADAVIRASGMEGAHAVFIGAGTSPSYLNIHQSPYDFLYAHLPDAEGFHFTFTSPAMQAARPTRSNGPLPTRCAHSRQTLPEPRSSRWHSRPRG